MAALAEKGLLPAGRAALKRVLVAAGLERDPDNRDMAARERLRESRRDRVKKQLARFRRVNPPRG